MVPFLVAPVGAGPNSISLLVPPLPGLVPVGHRFGVLERSAV